MAGTLPAIRRGVLCLFGTGVPCDGQREPSGPRDWRDGAWHLRGITLARVPSRRDAAANITVSRSGWPLAHMMAYF